MKSLFLLLLFLSNIGIVKADAVYLKDPERHILIPGGTEIFIQGPGVKLIKGKMLRGIFPFLGHTTRFKKIQNGTLLFDVAYTVDKNKFRTSSASHLPGKKKHFFLFDGSIAFGEGLNDDETIQYWINRKSKIYEAYELGFLGEGPQHHWIRLNEKKLPGEVPQKKGSALIITHQSDIGKFTGFIPHLTYGYDFPRLLETRPGEFKNVGTFKKNGNFFQRMLSNYCVPIRFCYVWMMNYGHGDIPDEDIAMGAKVIEATVKMYREQFDVENVTILWLGTDEALKVFQKYSKLKIIHIHFDAQEGGHPSRVGALQIANALFENKIVE